MHKFIYFKLIMVVIFIMLVGCTAKPSEAPTVTITIIEPTEVLPSITSTIESTLTPEPTSTFQPSDSPKPTQESLSPAPQRIEFESEDGMVLIGNYYPPAQNPAPLIVLMHLARGDQTDWVEIAQWLQNRMDEYPDEEMPSDTIISSMLPLMPENLSFAVFTFDFRGFGESTQSGAARSPQGWLMDANAAVSVAKHQPGVDTSRSLNIGASIGADGVVDACVNGCIGALSFSPGSYLGVPYASAVSNLEATSSDALSWCLASEGDAPSIEACNSADGVNYTRIIYPGNAHGMDLFKPGLEPPVGHVLQDFIFFTLGIE